MKKTLSLITIAILILFGCKKEIESPMVYCDQYPQCFSLLLLDGDNQPLIGADRTYLPNQLNVFNTEGQLMFGTLEYPNDTMLIVYYGDPLSLNRIYLDLGASDIDTIDIQMSEAYHSECGDYYLIKEFRYNNQLIEPNQRTGIYRIFK